MTHHVQASKQEVCALAGMAKRCGFSLVEVSLALLVVSIGLLAIVGLFPTSLGMGKRAIDETYASFLADSAFASFKGATAYYTNTTTWTQLNQYKPIAPNTVNYNSDVFWKNSADLQLKADGNVHILKYTAGSTAEKWDGAWVLSPSWSMEDHALRYRLTMTPLSNDPTDPKSRVTTVTLQVWMGEFGSTDPDQAEIFYTELYNHGI